MRQWSRVAMHAMNPQLEENRMASKNSSVAVPAQVQAPEGFRHVGSVANAGWFNMKKVGNTVQGTFEGMFKRKDDLNPEKTSKFFQVKITAGECEVRMGKGEESVLATAHVGDVVNLNYGPKTKELEELLSAIEKGAEYEIFGTVAGDKIKLSGGRTMHNFELFKKLTVEATSDVEPDFEGGSDDLATA
jgi:hypothetical protein